jgi:tetratricopeptide repeat protein 30
MTRIQLQTSPEEAYQKFEVLAKKHVDGLRKLSKKVQDARVSQSDEGIAEAVQEYTDAVDKFMPVLMSQAHIYWERGNYAQVQKIFLQSAEFCEAHEAWKLNAGHVFFMQGDKYEEAIRFYEPFVKKHEVGACRCLLSAHEADTGEPAGRSGHHFGQHLRLLRDECQE